MPNSSWASITSRPLFISVLESMVIFGPIFQVGCASACSTPTSARSAAVRPRNGPPLAVSTIRDDLAAGVDAGSQALMDRAVLAVDGHQFGAGGRPQRLHHRRPGDEALLVGQRQSLAQLQRADRDGEPGEADDTVDHHVGVVGQIGEVGDHLRRTAAPRRPRPAGCRRRRRRPSAGTRWPGR